MLGWLCRYMRISLYWRYVGWILLGLLRVISSLLLTFVYLTLLCLTLLLFFLILIYFPLQLLYLLLDLISLPIPTFTWKLGLLTLSGCFQQTLKHLLLFSPSFHFSQLVLYLPDFRFQLGVLRNILLFSLFAETVLLLLVQIGWRYVVTVCNWG